VKCIAQLPCQFFSGKRVSRSAWICSAHCYRTCHLDKSVPVSTWKQILMITQALDSYRCRGIPQGGFKISRTLPFQIKGFVCTRKRRVCQKSSKLCTYLRSSRMLSNCTLANRNASRFHLYITCCVCPPTSYASDILCLHFAFQFLMYRNGHGGRPRHFQ
jgi:hypothetical protein